MYRNIIPASLLLSLLGFAPDPAKADWQVYKFLDLGVTATDSRQFADVDEIAYSVRPSVELAFEGNRFNTDITASVEAYHFNEQDDEVVDPRFELDTSGTLVDGLLYINSSLEYGKVFSGESPFDLDASSEPKARIRVNPFIARQIGRYADFYLGFGHQALDNDVDSDFDFRQDTVGFSFSRNPRFGGFIWGVGGSYEKSRVNEDGLRDYDSSALYASLGSTVGESVLLQLIGGQETNDFASLDEVPSSNSYMEARLNWTPSERTSLTVGFSDRFYAEGPTLSFTHRVRKSSMTASWARGVNNSRVALDSVTAFTETADAVVPTNSGSINFGDATSERLFVDERFSFEYKLAGRRSDFVVDAVYSDQRELGGDLSRKQGIGRLAFDRHLSSLTTLRLQYEHLIEETVESENLNENRLGIRLIYNFDRKERVSIIDEDSDL